MKWISAVAPNSTTEAAIDAVCRQIRLGMTGERVDLLLVFASTHHRPQAKQIAAELSRAFADATLLGCVSAGVIGAGREVEDAPCLSVLAARLPNVGLRLFHLTPRELAHESGSEPQWRARLGLGPEHQPSFLLLSDPITANTDLLLRALDEAYPGAPKVGGLLSGASPPAQNTLLYGSGTFPAGAAGLALYGDVVLDAVVAQGARAVGGPLKVTGCTRNLVHELNGQPALRVLEQELSRLTEVDRALLQRSPLVGVAQRAGGEEPRPGDLLVRNVLGLDRVRGAIIVGAMLQPGALIQLHVRDPRSATEELTELLARYHREREAPAAALMFSCLGRGAGFFGVPNHDSRILAQQLGRIPAGGMFCGGEIGPVHSRTWLHGYTTALGLIRSPSWN